MVGKKVTYPHFQMSCIISSVGEDIMSHREKCFSKWDKINFRVGKVRLSILGIKQRCNKYFINNEKLETMLAQQDLKIHAQKKVKTLMEC